MGSRTIFDSNIKKSVWLSLIKQDPILVEFLYQFSRLQRAEEVPGSTQNPEECDFIIDGKRYTYEQITTDLKKLSTLESVESMIRSFPEEVFCNPENYRLYYNNVTYEMGRLRFTNHDIGEKLGVTGKAIAKELVNPDNKGKEHKISPAYLLAFSLYFDVSPCYLIGWEDEPGMYYKKVFNPETGKMKKVIFLRRESFTQYRIMCRVTYIIRSLNSEIDRSLLDTDAKNIEMPNYTNFMESILIVCGAKNSLRKKIFTLMSNIPRISQLRGEEITYPEVNDCYPSESHYLGYTPERITIGMYLENELIYLGKKEFDLLDIFAHLVNAPEEVKTMVYMLLKNGGFTDFPQSFDRDSLFSEFRRIKQKAVRGKLM